MLNRKIINPYIRVAMNSVLTSPHFISERTLYDYEIIYVKEGNCKLVYNNVQYSVHKDQVIFIRPGIPHSIEVSDGSKFIQPHIHFDMIYNKNSEKTSVSFKSKDKMSSDELMLIQQDIFKDYDIPPVFIPKDSKQFKKKLFEIIDLYSQRKYNYELLCKSKTIELICIILEQFESEKEIKSGFTPDNSIIAAKEYIDNNFQFNITLNSLAEQLYINKYTLMRNFKSKYGINIIEYYRNQRLEYAIKLLVDTDNSVYSIGELLNFSDIYSFSRFFKNRTKMSPLEYRKKHR